MRTWLAGGEPPLSVPTPTFWGRGVQKLEVGTRARGWRAVNLPCQR